jgi:hypothetical protein
MNELLFLKWQKLCAAIPVHPLRSLESVCFCFLFDRRCNWRHTCWVLVLLIPWREKLMDQEIRTTKNSLVKLRTLWTNLCRHASFQSVFWVLPCVLLKECGGIMPLSDVYCRINRARGIEVGQLAVYYIYLYLKIIVLDAVTRWFGERLSLDGHNATWLQVSLNFAKHCISYGIIRYKWPLWKITEWLQQK